ncbi:MAG: L,D-transpeptidase [Nitrospirae bacterium]|nr:L,D-transpeptidase [Nitrospirota bacterium]MDE3048421.1 L,D-transpeptidase [Nitrospirota bacterium]
MSSHCRRIRWGMLGWGALALAGSLSGCVEAVPQDVIEAVENIDRDLMELRAAEFSPNDYTRFAHQWMALKSRVQADEDLIRWPWEPNDLEIALRQLQEEGSHTVARLTKERESLRRSAEDKIARVEDRFRMMILQVSAIDSRLVLGQKPVETDLLMKQAHAFYEQGRYDRSLDASDRAAQNLATQAAVLSSELGRYANRDRISRWQEMAKDTVTWSRIHRTSAIVISKADRVLTLYRNGQKVLAYPVRLGFNGIREKRYQGDGATPEGRYRISSKRGQGQTQFYRALVLDYPNEDDRRRYRFGRKTGQIPTSRAIGGQIEIHGVENELMAQTLGCVMLDNPKMVLLYDRVDKGTPVTIVGALHEQNSVALTLAALDDRREET